jgi:hypothetical protein
MLSITRKALTTLVGLTSLLLALMPAQTAFAQGIYQSGTFGLDISFPQCNAINFPTTASNGAPYQFGVIGVTGGRAFTRNPCLGPEYQAITQQGLAPSFYINVNSPRGPMTPFEQNGPNGTCDPSDLACRGYNYGWNTAQYAYGYAQQTLQSLDISTLPNTWWLDVETENFWSNDQASNAQVIQGALDFFRGTTVSSGGNGQNPNTSIVVGIYSVPSMWESIMGTFTQGSLPAWIAGARSLGSASQLCSDVSFTGGPTWLVQYWNGVSDQDYAC